MEIAVTVIQAAGMRAVLAQSFARTFYRNAINNGLLALECDTSGIAEGDGLSLHVSHDRIDVSNQRTGRTSPCPALPSFLLAILEAGGLVPYMKAHGHSLRPR
jgi:3-isopropylmalate/(R)-2-methylmalate dehydratase small subunit